MMQTMLSLFGTVILSNSALQLVSAQSSNPVDPHAFMWSDWEHHKSLNLDIPENGSCSQLIDQLECEKHRDCGWNQQSSSCYFAADPDFAPVTDDENIRDNDENPSRMLRGEREMNVVVPEGGCSSIKVQGQCGYYNGCYWVNKVGCLAKVTPKPTSPLPTASPVSCSTITSSSRCNYYDHCLWKKDKNGKWTCFSADDDSVETPSPTKTSKPTSKESTPKPTPKPKPGVEQEVCDYPSGGCASLRGDKNSCGEHSGCAWSTKKRACVNNGKCAKTSPPHSTPRPTIPKQERIKIADMCSTPPTGCQGFRLSECEKYNGCYIAGGICTNRKCNQYDCAIRQLAFDMAVTLLPRCQGKVAPNLGMDDCISELKDVHDGLELNARCGFKFNPGHHDTDGSSKPANLPLRKIYVSIATGDDDKGDGSFSKPYKTIQQGVVAAREFSGSSRAVILRAGTYYVTETVVLGPSDSGLTIAPYENENVIVSGAMPLDGIEWKSYSNKIYVADVSKYANKLGHLSQVYFDDKPATRARHPNADPWSQGLFTRQNTGYFESAESWPPAFDTGPSSVLIKQGIRTQNSRYGRYSLGYGGHSSIFTPPASYWAVRNPVAGGGCMFELPRGVEMRAGHFQGIPTTFKRPTDAYVHAYHIYHWGNWVFRVGSQNGKTLMFQGGGFQEARGSCGKGGSQFYIENMLELLDSKNEFYLDTLENKLYYFPNTTTSDADSIPTAVATVNRRIFQIAGDSSNPVKNVVITGLKIEKTYATWMDPHEVPSAGDWSVTRNAAIFIEGAENAVVHGNSFYHMGGNGVFVSNYARNVKITANRFKYLAASAVLVVGDHRYNTQNPWEMLDPNHPFDTVVDGNIASEIGNVVKQSAGFFQALARGSIVQNNVIFNSERTAVNFNDGYGGDNKVYSNLMFNTVRSTIDHGPFNSWDRQPYIQSHPGSNNQITSEPMMSYVKGNYLLGGYGGIKGIDHDDGSTLWENSYNLLVYGYQKLKGRDQESYKNVAMFPMDFTVFLSEPIGIPSSRLLWHDNIMVTSDSTQPYGFGSDNTCSRSVFQADNNELYVAGTFWANCFGESAKSWGVWKGNGQDKGSTIKNKLPSTLEMVLMGYDVLGLDKNGVK